MKQYVFEELGFFTKGQCERIAEKTNGKTYMNFKVGFSNCAGNYTLVVETDYDATEQEIKNFFLAYAIGSL